MLVVVVVVPFSAAEQEMPPLDPGGVIRPWSMCSRLEEYRPFMSRTSLGRSVAALSFIPLQIRSDLQRQAVDEIVRDEHVITYDLEGCRPGGKSWDF